MTVDFSLEERRARREVETAARRLVADPASRDELDAAITRARTVAVDGRLPWLPDVLAAAGVHPSLIGRLYIDHVAANLGDAVFNTPTWSTP